MAVKFIERGDKVGDGSEASGAAWPARAHEGERRAAPRRPIRARLPPTDPMLLPLPPQIDRNVERELVNHRSLMHPNIIAFREVFVTGTHLGIVMEYAAGAWRYRLGCLGWGWGRGAVSARARGVLLPALHTPAAPSLPPPLFRRRTLRPHRARRPLRRGRGALFFPAARVRRRVLPRRGRVPPRPQAGEHAAGRAAHAAAQGKGVRRGWGWEGDGAGGALDPASRPARTPSHTTPSPSLLTDLRFRLLQVGPLRLPAQVDGWHPRLHRARGPVPQAVRWRGRWRGAWGAWGGTAASRGLQN